MDKKTPPPGVNNKPIIINPIIDKNMPKTDIINTFSHLKQDPVNEATVPGNETNKNSFPKMGGSSTRKSSAKKRSSVRRRRRRSAAKKRSSTCRR